MRTRLTTVDELKGIFIELMLNHTDKVTKVSPLSATNGIAYGNAKIAQRVIKDIALIESHLFPDSAFGTNLDTVAENNGIAPRLSLSGSTTYVRVVGTPGTVYNSGVHTFTGNHGKVFDIVTTSVIGVDGFSYIKVNSQEQGEITNVDALTLSKVTPVPVGHQYCINEFAATGGRDFESDEDFRKRIKEGSNILARGTLAMLQQVFIKINPNVFKIYYNGIDRNGKVIISIMTQNGADLTTPELNNILLKGKQYFSLTELKPDGVNGYGISLQNITWFPVDVSTRLILEQSVNPDDVRKECQIRLNKYFDYRYFNKKKVEWDDLLQIVKGTPGVKYVLDNYFSPATDILIPRNQIPRMRGFLMLNPDGSIIVNSTVPLNN
jgi:uncharacterized phage protein gp47/JayE